MCLALILCSGDAKQKTSVFYNILQDANQEYISASDKDFEGAFDQIVDCAYKVVNEFEPTLSNQPAEKTAEELEKIDGLKEEMHEAFLDSIYGAMSKLKKEEYKKKVLDNEKWIFSSNGVRTHVDKLLKEKDQQ